MAPCKECRGTGLRGADGTTPDHVGKLVTCVSCKGTGNVPEDEQQAGDAATETEAIHTPADEEVQRPGILRRILG